MKVIEGLNGKQITTVYDDESTIEYFNEVVEEYNRMPDFNDVKKELKGILLGGSKKTLVNKYFLQSVHDKVVVKGCKWSIADVYSIKEVFDIFYSKSIRNPDVFLDDESPLRRISTAIRLGGSHFARQATYYPIDNVRYLLNKYCSKNGNYYDYSCGWGDRLLASLSSGVNYYGTDPNYELVDKLKDMVNVSHELTNNLPFSHLYTQGSEECINTLINNIDFAFSSPPYFDLEDYVVGNQSYKNGTSYESWLNNYMKPTMENIYKYLKDTGYFAINIKNSKEHLLLDDCVKLAKEVGFRFLCFEDLENIRRFAPTGEVDNDEKIAVFSKGIDLPKEQKQAELW